MRTAQSAARSGEPGPALEALVLYAESLGGDRDRRVLPVSGPKRTADRGIEDQSRTGTEDQSPADQAPTSTDRTTRTITGTNAITADHGDRPETGPVLTPSPEDCKPRTTMGRPRRTGSRIEIYVEAVKTVLTDGGLDRVPSFKEVEAALDVVLPQLGLKPSKSRVTRVLEALMTELAGHDHTDH